MLQLASSWYRLLQIKKETEDVLVDICTFSITCSIMCGDSYT